jgi:hypothetical protein
MTHVERHWHSIANLSVLAVRSFCATMFLMLCVGLVTALSAYLVLAQNHPIYGVIGGVLALLECTVVGFVWAVKRGILMALIQGLKEYSLGKAVVRLLFHRFLGVSENDLSDERGGVIASTVERLPLAQAEKRLRQAVHDLLDSPETGSGLANRARRWLQTQLLRRVEAYTLARFRERGAAEGGVDLLLVQADLENHLDDLLVTKMSRSLRLWTLVVLLGLPAQILGTVYLVMALLK